jgi:hypothetical protein
MSVTGRTAHCRIHNQYPGNVFKKLSLLTFQMPLNQQLGQNQAGTPRSIESIIPRIVDEVAEFGQD